MSNKPYRLAQVGSRIDRTKKVHFSFDGKQLTGFAGDTLASAVMANGSKLFGRSFKYHRPRGVVGLGSEEMNALVGVGDGSRHEPNLRATQVELFDGLQAVSQNPAKTRRASGCRGESPARTMGSSIATVRA